MSWPRTATIEFLRHEFAKCSAVYVALVEVSAAMKASITEEQQRILDERIEYYAAEKKLIGDELESRKAAFES
jgi:hypothetical protein